MVRIGLISDTHIPKRWKAIPEAVFDIFAGVDLILHSGDVGELSVLDQLGKIAPVAAVYGNDETKAATEALPFLQMLAIAGHRLVLVHGYDRDMNQELARRRDDRWEPKFDFLTDYGAPHGADILVYGHSHIPMVKPHRGMLLINPGAIASGSFFTRQKLQTVAMLTLTQGETPQVTHIDISQPERPHHTPFDWEAGFAAAQRIYNEPIAEPQLLSQLPWLREHIVPLADPELIDELLLPVAHECWYGQRGPITVTEFISAMTTHKDVPPAIVQTLRESPFFGSYLR